MGASSFCYVERVEWINPHILLFLLSKNEKGEPVTPLFVNDKQTVLMTRHDDPRTSPFIVGGGQVRFANGDIMSFGVAPRF